MDEYLTRILNLKECLSHYDTKEFLPYFIDGLNPFDCINNSGDNLDVFQKSNLTSPEMQTKYIAGLLICSENKNNKHLDKDTCDFIKKEVREITSYYADNTLRELFANNEPMDQDKLMADTLSITTFLSYYDMGNLRYPEQTEEMIKFLYLDYSSYFEREFGVSINDLLDFNELCIMSFNKSNSHFKNSKDVDLLGIIPGVDYGDLFCIKRNFIASLLGTDKTNKIFNLFSISRKDRSFNYYNNKNPLDLKPLIEIDANTYMVLSPFSIIEAFERFLFEFFENPKQPFFDTYKNKKGHIVEKQFLIKLKELIGQGFKYYLNVCEHGKTDEHDIVIETDNNIFVCEVKSSKVQEPFFNVEKGYTRLIRHFNSSNGIGYAYKQAMKLIHSLQNTNDILLYQNGKDEFALHDLRKKKIKPIVLTFYRFGLISINCSQLLVKDANDDYPWICNFADLENILEIKKYFNISADDVISYIEWRIKNHERILAEDEVGIFEVYNFGDIKEDNSNSYLALPLLAGKLCDQLYYKKHGAISKITIPDYDIAFDKINLSTQNGKTYVRKNRKIGPNEPCPCGSGKKFKKCCKGLGIYD